MALVQRICAQGSHVCRQCLRSGSSGAQPRFYARFVASCENMLQLGPGYRRVAWGTRGVCLCSVRQHPTRHTTHTLTRTQTDRDKLRDRQGDTEKRTETETCTALSPSHICSQPAVIEALNTCSDNNSREGVIVSRQATLDTKSTYISLCVWNCFMCPQAHKKLQLQKIISHSFHFVVCERRY